MTHEPECECAYVEPGECACLWLRRAHKRGLRDAAACIEAEFPKPTLGIQKAIRILQEMAGA